MQTASAAPLTVIGVDIGKDVFHLVGFDTKGKIAFRRQFRRLARRDLQENSTFCRWLRGLSQCAFLAVDSSSFQSGAERARNGQDFRPLSAELRKPTTRPKRDG